MSVALSNPYCTLAQLQEEVRNNKATENDWFSECINTASRWVEEECGRDFWFHDHSSSALVVHPSYIVGDMICLPWPILTLTEVADDGYVVPSDEYYVDGSAIHRDGEWSRYLWKRTITLKGTFGYTLDVTNPTTTPPTGLPKGIQRATVLVAAAHSIRNNRTVVGADGNTESVLNTTIPQEAFRQIARYRRRFF